MVTVRNLIISIIQVYFRAPSDKEKMMMISSRKKALDPRFVRLDASTVCQLKCPSCPTATGATGQNLGVGSLKFEDFKRFIRRNPQVSHVELSNWGEVFLNQDLVK